MDIFDVLTLLGGIALFLFGMTYMGDALKKLAGHHMRNILSNVTSNPLKGFIVGLAVTMIIQSSTATNVMVLSFINAGMMSLANSIPLMIGANLGTTVTAWIMSLSEINGAGLILKFFRPASLTPILIFIGVLLYRFSKKQKKNDIGAILIGFGLLLFGMINMSSAMSGMSEMPGFADFFTYLKNPVLGLVTGILAAAIMQSSSAAIGVLQALALAGDITFESAIPLVLGINIGQVLPVMIAATGTSKDSKRAAVIDLYLNIAGAVIALPVYMILKGAGALPFVTAAATPVTIAITHSVYKLLCSVFELPLCGLFEKLGHMTVKESSEPQYKLLDSRFMATPALALAQCRARTGECIKACRDALEESYRLFGEDWDEEAAKKIHEAEELCDRYQDELNAYLAKLSVRSMTEKESREVTHLMHVAAESENVSDHIYHMAVAMERFMENGETFSKEAHDELLSIMEKLSRLMELSEALFYSSDIRTAGEIAELEKTLLDQTELCRDNNLDRLKKDMSTVSEGSAFTDLLLDFERIADHLSKEARLALAK